MKMDFDTFKMVLSNNGLLFDNLVHKFTNDLWVWDKNRWRMTAYNIYDLYKYYSVYPEKFTVPDVSRRYI